MNAKIQGRSTPFGEKKGGGQLQTKNIIGALAYNSCLYSPYLLDTWHSLYRKPFRRLWMTFVDHFVLRMFDLGGRWAMTLKDYGAVSAEKQGR